LNCFQKRVEGAAKVSAEVILNPFATRSGNSLKSNP